MKVISIWQPFADLAAVGIKQYETRGWPAPASLIGERIGIASTKQIKPEQFEAMKNRALRRHYPRIRELDLKEDFYHGYLLGTVTLDGCVRMDRKLIKAVGAQERAFGFWKVGRYAWRLTNPRPYSNPIPVHGQQGLWNYEAELESLERTY